MEYVYAALLLHKLKQNITEDSVKSVVKAAGVAPDDVRVKALVAALSRLASDSRLVARLAQAARDTRHTSIQDHVREVESIYSEVTRPPSADEMPIRMHDNKSPGLAAR